MEKFNLKEAKAKLGEIMDVKAPAVKLTPENLKQAVMDNLPHVANEDVKDFMEHLGIGDNKDILPGQLRKEKQIEKFVDKKQSSMRDFAIKRDACMFAVAELNAYYPPNPKEKSSETHLKELHDKWLMYFEGIYE